MLVKASTQEFFHHVVALLNQSLALGVSGAAIHDRHISGPLLHQGVNDVVDKFTPIVRM